MLKVGAGLDFVTKRAVVVGELWAADVVASVAMHYYEFGVFSLRVVSCLLRTIKSFAIKNSVVNLGHDLSPRLGYEYSLPLDKSSSQAVFTLSRQVEA
jgi:hypothetical protein